MARRPIPPPTGLLYYFPLDRAVSRIIGAVADNYVSVGGTGHLSPNYDMIGEVGWNTSGGPAVPTVVDGIFDYAQQGSSFAFMIPNAFGPIGYPASGSWIASFGGWFKGGIGSIFNIIDRVGSGVPGQLLVRKDGANITVVGYNGGQYLFPANDGPTYAFETIGTYPDDGKWHHVIITITNDFGGALNPSMFVTIDKVSQTPDMNGRPGVYFTNDHMVNCAGSLPGHTDVALSDQFLYLRDITASPTDLTTLYGDINGGYPTFESPAPTIVSVVVGSYFVVTATANAGPSDSPSFSTWWEITLASGIVVKVASLINQAYGTNHNHADTFTIPDGQNWNGAAITFNMESPDAAQRWQTSPLTLPSTGFNRNGYVPPPAPPTYPGAVLPIADIAPVEEFDFYNVDAVDLSVETIYAPVPSVDVTKTVTPLTTAKQLLIANLKAGLYSFTYAAGAFFDGNNGLWNYYNNTYFGTQMGGLWLQSGDELPYYVLPDPCFRPAGYATQNDATTAAVNFTFMFLHLGGDLSARTDYANGSTPNTGTIDIRIQSVGQPDLGTGEWTLVNSTMVPAPYVYAPAALAPSIRGLSPGNARFRYTLKALDNKARFQDFNIDIWDRDAAPADAFFPFNGPKPPPASTIGWGGTLKERRVLYPKPQTSGNVG